MAKTEPELSTKGTVQAVQHPNVVRGIGIVLNKEDEIVYAGPLGSVPKLDDFTILLNPEDYKSLKEFSDKRKD